MKQGRIERKREGLVAYTCMSFVPCKIGEGQESTATSKAQMP